MNDAHRKFIFQEFIFLVMVPELYFCKPFSVLTSKPDEWEELGFPHESVSPSPVYLLLSVLAPRLADRESTPPTQHIQLRVSSQESRDVLEGTLETSHARPQHLQDWLASWSHGRVCLPLLPNAALSSNYRVWIQGKFFLVLVHGVSAHMTPLLQLVSLALGSSLMFWSPFFVGQETDIVTSRLTAGLETNWPLTFTLLNSCVSFSSPGRRDTNPGFWAWYRLCLLAVPPSPQVWGQRYSGDTSWLCCLSGNLAIVFKWQGSKWLLVLSVTQNISNKNTS